MSDRSKEKRSSKPLYPVNLDVTGKRCLVVGGGTVASRKIKALLLCGGDVQIISPEACKTIVALAESAEITWLPRAYQSSDVKGAFLVFAATDSPQVQKQIAEDAARHHVLLNSADDRQLSDFHVPAKIRRGDFVISISTGGGSPALATLLKAKLAQEYGAEYGTLVDLMAKIRAQVVGGSSVPDENKALFQAVLDLPVLDYIRTGNWTELEKLLAGILPPGINSGLLLAELKNDRDKLSG